MTTKIDISSLGSIIKETIDKLGKRSKEMCNGIDIEVPVTYTRKFNIRWEDGANTIYHDTHEPPVLDKEMGNKLLKPLNDEIAIIRDFSDSCAGCLCVDPDKFFSQYFT
jgi:hypothetical protein